MLAEQIEAVPQRAVHQIGDAQGVADGRADPISSSSQMMRVERDFGA